MRTLMYVVIHAFLIDNLWI